MHVYDCSPCTSEPSSATPSAATSAVDADDPSSDGPAPIRPGGGGIPCIGGSPAAANPAAAAAAAAAASGPPPSGSPMPWSPAIANAADESCCSAGIIGISCAAASCERPSSCTACPTARLCIIRINSASSSATEPRAPKSVGSALIPL